MGMTTLTEKVPSSLTKGFGEGRTDNLEAPMVMAVIEVNPTKLWPVTTTWVPAGLA